MKRYSFSAIGEAAGVGRELVALYGQAHGWSAVRGADIGQVIEFMKAMNCRKGGRVAAAEVSELRALLQSAGLV